MRIRQAAATSWGHRFPRAPDRTRTGDLLADNEADTPLSCESMRHDAGIPSVSVEVAAATGSRSPVRGSGSCRCCPLLSWPPSALRLRSLDGSGEMVHGRSTVSPVPLGTAFWAIPGSGARGFFLDGLGLMEACGKRQRPLRRRRLPCWSGPDERAQMHLVHRQLRVADSSWSSRLAPTGR